MSVADIMEWLTDYGAILTFFVALFSCLALPVPASLVFMAAGTIASSGDSNLIQFWVAGILGASWGDQIGYWIGKKGIKTVINGRWNKSYEKAQDFLKTWGGWSIFLTRWLISPLGPWVNFSAGAVAYSWPRFTIASTSGEVVWVTVYLFLGYSFSENAQIIIDVLTNGIWLIIAGFSTIIIGRKLYKTIHEPKHT